MTAIDTMARSAAASSIARYGKAITYKSVKLGQLDTSTGMAARSTVNTDLHGLMDGSSLRTLGYRFGEALVQVGDFQITIAAADLAVEPKMGDLVTVDGRDVTVQGSRPIWSGDEVALYELLVRR